MKGRKRQRNNFGFIPESQFPDERGTLIHVQYMLIFLTQVWFYLMGNAPWDYSKLLAISLFISFSFAEVI